MNLVLNHEGFEGYLENERTLLGGVQYQFRFKNNYGASVVKHPYSYGSMEDLWEVAVIKYDDYGGWDLCYDTDITCDVIGHLSDEEVRDILKRIQEL